MYGLVASINGEGRVWCGPVSVLFLATCAKHSSSSMGDKMRSQEVGRDKEEV